MQMWFVCKTIQMWFVWLQECLEASFPKAYVRHALKCIKTEAIDSSDSQDGKSQGCKVSIKQQQEWMLWS